MTECCYPAQNVSSAEAEKSCWESPLGLPVQWSFAFRNNPMPGIPALQGELARPTVW